MLKAVKYNSCGKKFIFACDGDRNRINLEASSLDKINDLEGDDIIIKIIDKFLADGEYPTFDQIIKVYNYYKYEQAKKSDVVTEDWILQNTTDSPQTRSIMLMYKNIVDAFGVEITKTKFLNDINKAVDDYNKICVLFNLKEMRTGYHQVEDEKQDTKFNIKTSCSDDLKEFNNYNHNIVRDFEPSKNIKTDNTKVYNLSGDLKEFLKENGYTNKFEENYYNSPIDPYEDYNKFKSNNDYNEYYKEAYKRVREEEDHIGNEVDNLIKDFTLYLKKGDFKYILVNEFSKEFLKQSIKLSKDHQVLVEIRGVFEVFLNGFTGSSKMMKRLLHLIDVENADRSKIKSLLELELRSHICKYGAEVIDKKFNYLIKTKVYYENYKYFIEAK